MDELWREAKVLASKRRGVFIVSDEHMARARQDDWYQSVEHAVENLVRINLVYRPNHPVTEQPRDSQPQHEVPELEEGKMLRDAPWSPPDPVERLWPMKMEDIRVSAVPPQPPHLEPGTLDNLDSYILEVAVQ
jgi:hypothetical protein